MHWGVLAVALLSTASLRAEEWNFEAKPGERLLIDLKTGGDIELRGVAGTAVHVAARLHGRDAETVRVTAERDKSGVRIESEQTARRRNTSAGVDLVIELPTRFDVELSSMGGEVSIEDLEGDLSGQTMGGELNLRKVRGTVNLSTMGGSIEVVDTVASGKVSTMGGNVRLTNVRGGLRGSTMGGQVRIVGGDTGVSDSEGPTGHAAPQSGDVVQISSMGGAIHVESAPNGADVKTMGGNVRIDSARRFVKASTMGGDVDIDKADGDVHATSMGGDVTVQVIGDGGDVDLETMAGRIELTLPAGFAGSFDLELEFTQNSRRSYEIRSDFPLTQRRDADWRYGHGTPRKSIYGEGKSGDGRHTVRIHAINGDIVIRKGS